MKYYILLVMPFFFLVSCSVLMKDKAEVKKIVNDAIEEVIDEGVKS